MQLPNARNQLTVTPFTDVDSLLCRGGTDNDDNDDDPHSKYSLTASECGLSGGRKQHHRTVKFLGLLLSAGQDHPILTFHHDRCYLIDTCDVWHGVVLLRPGFRGILFGACIGGPIGPWAGGRAQVIFDESHMISTNVSVPHGAVQSRPHPHAQQEYFAA